MPFVSITICTISYFTRILLRKYLENSSLAVIGQWFKMEVIHEGMIERKKRTFIYIVLRANHSRRKERIMKS